MVLWWSSFKLAFRYSADACVDCEINNAQDDRFHLEELVCKTLCSRNVEETSTKLQPSLNGSLQSKFTRGSFPVLCSWGQVAHQASLTCSDNRFLSAFLPRSCSQCVRLIAPCLTQRGLLYSSMSYMELTVLLFSAWRHTSQNCH